MSSLAKISIRFNADLKQFSSQMQNVQRTLKSTGKQMTSVGKNLTMGLTAPILGLGTIAIKTFANFEQSMAKVAAISGATAEQLTALRQNAEDLGSATRFAATDVAGLQLEFSKLGFDPSQILDATEATLALAQASGEDLAQSAIVAASTVQGFGLQASETGRVVDVMANSFSSSALDLTKFQTAMATVAPVAKSAGQSIETTTGMLAVLTNNGLDASTAGTGLRNIFLDIAKAGLTMEEALDMINTSTNKNVTAMDLFGKRGATVATVLAENQEAAKGFTKEFENAAGSAKAMAAIMDNTLEGSFLRLKSAAESAFISIGTVLAPVVRKVADFVANVIAKFKELSPSIQKTIVVIAGLAAAIGPVLVALGFLMTTVIPGLIAAFGALSAPILAIVAAIVAVGIAIYKHWEPIKKTVLDIANYFIDLYNESVIVRVGVEAIALQFKILFQAAKLVFNGLGTLISGWWRQTKIVFSSFGQAFKAIITGNFSKLPGILDKNLAKTQKNFKKTLGQLSNDVDNFKVGLQESISDSIDNIAGRKKLELSADVTVDNVKVSEQASGQLSAGLSGQGSGGRAQVQSASTLETQGAESIGNISSDLISEDDLIQMSAFNEQLLLLRERAQIVGSEVGAAFEGMSSRMIASLELANSGFQGFVKNMASTIMKLISMLLSNAIANAVAGATQSAVGTGPAAVFTQPAFIATAVGGVLAAFASIPKFADGGIVGGPTIGMMGEYAGARSNPEVIAPLDKLKSMLGDSVGGDMRSIRVEGKIKGQDIILQNARATNYRNRRG